MRRAFLSGGNQGLSKKFFRKEGKLEKKEKEGLDRVYFCVRLPYYKEAV